LTYIRETARHIVLLRNHRHNKALHLTVILLRSIAAGELDVKRMKQIEPNPTLFCLRATPFGPVVTLWSVYRSEPKIWRIVLSKPRVSAKQVVKEFFPNSMASSCSRINVLVDQIEAFLNGEDVQFSLDIVRFDLCSAFQKTVLRAEYAIPRGRISTYRLIAKHLGNPNGARAVGTALATNPFPIVIPCHRAIRSDGALGGYQGGLKMKRTLLDMEGVAFRNGDHVATRDFFYGDRETV
jgi:methylated-DNA-[protein]-cysteine S-methyltransferase